MCACVWCMCEIRVCELMQGAYSGSRRGSDSEEEVCWAPCGAPCQQQPRALSCNHTLATHQLAWPVLLVMGQVKTGLGLLTLALCD